MKNDTNLVRFILAFFSCVLLIPLIIITAIILIFPTLAVFSLLTVIIGIAVFIFGIASFFIFLWYISREEPKDESDKKDYSLNQMKDS